MGKEYASKYRNEGPLPISRRLYSSLVDSLIMIVVSFCLLLLSASITSSTPYYKEQNEIINTRRNEIYALEEETKLFEFNKNDDGTSNYNNIIDQNTIFKKYIYSHVLYSYNQYKEEWDNKYVKESDDPYSIQKDYKVEPASFSNDYLGYFFVEYASKYNQDNNLFTLEKGETYISHFKNVLRNNSKGSEWEYFEENDRLPCLKMDYAYTLYRYTFFDEGGQTGLNSYNYLISQYQGVYNEATSTLFQSSRYQAIYNEYKEAYGNCSKIVSLFSFISYIAAFLLAYLLPILIFKRGQTIGIFLFHGALVHKEGLEISKGQVLLRSIYSFFSFFPIMLFSCYLAGGLNSGWMYPLFSIGGSGISLFNITVISFIFPLANLIALIVNKQRRGLSELISKTMVIDTKYFETAPEAVIVKKETKEEKGETSLVAVDKPYFDSSCFDNKERDKDN